MNIVDLSYGNPIKVSLAVSHEETHHFVLQASQSVRRKKKLPNQMWNELRKALLVHAKPSYFSKEVW